MLAKTPKRTRARVAKAKKPARAKLITKFTDEDLPSELRTPRHRLAGQHTEDPAKVIHRAIGDISGFKVKGNWVLLGLYVRPAKTIGGIHLADVTLSEDEWQGKVALVLKLGPRAYVDDATVSFHDDDKCKPGDWAMMWPTDGRKLKVNGYLCRMVRDFEVRATIEHPDMVY